MAPKNSSEKSKCTGAHGRSSTKMDKNQILGVCSKLTNDLQWVRKKHKEQGRKIRLALKSLEELQESLMYEDQAVSNDNFEEFQSRPPVLEQRESSAGPKRLHLSFSVQLPSLVFTQKMLDTIDKAQHVKVELLDEDGKLVNEGVSSSLEIELFVAHGDIEGLEELTVLELESRRIKARKEKGALLVGRCETSMINGVCFFTDLKFVDNSSWVRSKTFRLVAKVADTVQVRDIIRPAVSRAFRVKDQRGMQYEKHKIPSWNDEVWRLMRIARTGAFHRKLDEHGITTVMDFLRQYYIDESSLRKIVGAKEGVWATIVQHAKACPVSGEYFQYTVASKAKVFFDCFYKLVGASIDGQIYQPLEKISDHDRIIVEILKRHALVDRSNLVPINYLVDWSSGFNITFAQKYMDNEILMPLWDDQVFNSADLFLPNEAAGQSTGTPGDFSTVASGCSMASGSEYYGSPFIG